MAIELVLGSLLKIPGGIGAVSSAMTPKALNAALTSAVSNAHNTIAFDLSNAALNLKEVAHAKHMVSKVKNEIKKDFQPSYENVISGSKQDVAMQVIANATLHDVIKQGINVPNLNDEAVLLTVVPNTQNEEAEMLVLDNSAERSELNTLIAAIRAEGVDFPEIATQFSIGNISPLLTTDRTAIAQMKSKMSKHLISMQEAERRIQEQMKQQQEQEAPGSVNTMRPGNTQTKKKDMSTSPAVALTFLRPGF